MSYDSYDEDMEKAAKQEKLQQEIKENSHLIENNPENTAAYFNRGCAYLEQCDSEVTELLDLAISDFNSCIARDSTNADAYYRRGSASIIKYYFRKIFLNNDNFLKQKILSVNNQEYNDRIRGYYADLKEYYYKHSEDYDFIHAINDFNKSLQLNPKLFDVYLSRGHAYYQYSINQRSLFEINLSIQDYLSFINNTVNIELCIYLQIGLSYYQKYCISKNKLDLNSAAIFFKNIIITQFPRSVDDPQNPFISISESEYDLILNCFTEALSFSPLKTSLYIYRGTLYMMKCEDYEVQSYIEHGYCNYDNEYNYNVNLAIADYNIALNLSPDNAKINRLIASLYDSKYRSRCGNRQQINDKTLAERYMAAFEKSWNTTLQQANHSFEKKSYLQSIKLYSKLIRYNPNDDQLFYNRGCAYFDISQYDSSLEDVNQAIAKNKSNYEYYSLRGNILLKKGIYDAAAKNFTLAINNGSINAYDYYSLGIIFKDKDNAEYEKAIESISRAIKINPNDAAFFVGRGDCFYSLAFSSNIEITENQKKVVIKSKDPNSFLIYESNAIDDYTKAIKIDPDYVRAYAMRGTIYALQNEKNKANADLQKALLLAPQDQTVLRLKRLIDLNIE
jgi:tetratricopeptide (TPR) repeat protein